MLEDILGELDPGSKPSSAQPSKDPFSRNRAGVTRVQPAPAAVKTFSRGSRGTAGGSGSGAAAHRPGSGSAGVASGGGKPQAASAAGSKLVSAKPTESLSFGHKPADDGHDAVYAEVEIVNGQQQHDEHQEFSFAPPGVS